MRAAVLSLLLSVLLPATAMAATATVEESGAVRLTAGDGEQNTVVASSGGGTITLSDAAGLTARAGCTAAGAAVTCAGARLVMALGDGDDTVAVTGALPAVIDGGAGDDAITGGDADDVLEGGAGSDALAGGGGNDVLSGDGIALAVGGGDDRLDGGPGADVLLGDGGRDVADYSSRATSVSVTLDGLADDGAAGEGDAVNTEDLRGGAGNDVLVGDDAANTLDGGPGADRLTGAGGDDHLLARDGVADIGDCGDGEADTAEADAADFMTACESVELPPSEPAPPPPTVTAPPVVLLSPSPPAPSPPAPVLATSIARPAPLRVTAPRRVQASTIRRRGLSVTVRCPQRCRARVTARPLTARTVTAGPSGLTVHLRAPRKARLPATLTVRVTAGGVVPVVRRVVVVGRPRD